MSGTIGGATYVLQFQNAQVVQGMAQTQAAIASSQQQIVASLQQIVTSLNGVTQASNQATGQQGGGGILGAALSFVTFSAEIQLAHMAVDAMKDSLKFLVDGMIGFNDQLAKSHIAWEVFTGDAKSADEQVQALFEFSRKTPFTFQEVDAAARELAAFGGVAFATKENLELVGNIAAGTQRPIQTITYEFGQMYQEIDNGQPFGRAARALVQFGALSAETRTHLEAMQKAGASTSDMLKVFTDDLDRFNGLIDKQATQTLEGSMSTLKDTVQSLIAISTKPFFDEILGGVNEVNKAVGTNAALEFAANLKKLFQDILDVITIVVNAFKVDIGEMILTWRMFVLDVVQGAEGILNAMSQLPGGEKFKANAANLKTYETTIINSMKDLQSGIDQAGKDGADAYLRATDPNWTAAGENAAKSFATGFKNKFGTGTEDIDADARKYINDVTDAMKGMTSKQLSVFDNTTDFIKTILLGTTKGDPEKLMTEIRPMILDAIKGLHDDVNQGLVELSNVLPPEAFQQVKAYIESLHDAENAETALTVATMQLTVAQDNYNKVVAAGKEARDAANTALNIAKQQMQADMASYDHAIAAQNAALASLRQDAEDAAQFNAGVIQAAQDALNALQASIKAGNDELQRSLDEQQKKLDDLNKTKSEHEAAFTAILDGEVGRFLAQRNAIDATTQAIIDRYNAEVEGKIRAAAGDDERVTRLEREERAKLLQMDTQIRQLRAAGHEKEADALQTQRDKIAASYNDQIKYASQVAAVAKDKADEAKERVQKAADADSDKNAKDIDAQTKVIDNIKDEQKARKLADDEALAAAQQRVRDAQAEAKRVADDYKDREQAIQQNIISINAQKEAARVRDQAAVNAATMIKNIVDIVWTNAEKDAKDQLDHAKDTVQAAKDLKTAADNSLTSLQAVTKEWEKQYTYALQILNASRQLRDLPPVTTIPVGAPTSPQPGGETHPNQPGVDAGPEGSNTKPTTPAPAPINPVTNPSHPPSKDNPHFITPDAPGFIPTDARPYPDGTWWDMKNGFTPEGYELRNGDYLYWVGVPASSPPASPNNSPNFWGGTPTGGSGGGGLSRVSMSALLANQTPSPLTRPSVSGGMFGVAAMSGDGGKVGGNTFGDLHIPVDLSGMTVDSPSRVADVQHGVVSGIRQALLDAHSRGVGSRVGRKI